MDTPPPLISPLISPLVSDLISALRAVLGPFPAWILAIGLFVPGSGAWASTDNVLVGRCQAQGIDYSLYSLADAHQRALTEGETLSIITSVISPLSGLNLSTGGVYRPSLGVIELPKYWKQKSVPLTNCQMLKPDQTLNVLVLPGPTQELQMYVQVYFIEGDPNPDVDIDQMIQNHQAFPFKVHIICTTREAANPSPLGCVRVAFLDQIIPIDPPDAPHPHSLFSTSTAPAPQLESRLCGPEGPTSLIRASATIVARGKQVFVVTSSGAVASKFGINSCSQLLFNGLKIPLKLIRHDFSRDLAALEVIGSLPEGLKSSILSVAAPDQASDQLNVRAPEGPAAVEVLSVESDRHFIPRLGKVVEVRGSGFHSSVQGAAVSNENGEISGVVSSEYLKIFPGSYTRPIRWSKSDGDVSDHLIVIPSAAIAEFLDTVITSQGEPQIWLLDRGLSEKTGTRIQSGKLIFDEDCPPMDASQPAGQYPIGGIDPVGVGGDSANYRACKIQVKLAASATDPQFFRKDLQSWADTISAHLAAGNHVELEQQIWRTSEGLQRGFFYSAESFFQTVATLDASHQILELSIRPGRTIPGLEAKFDELRGLAQQERDADLSVFLNNQFGDPTTENLLRRIFLLCSMIESEQLPTLTEADFKVLTDLHGPFEHGWSLLSLAYEGGGLHKQLVAIEQKWSGH